MATVYSVCPHESIYGDGLLITRLHGTPVEINGQAFVMVGEGSRSHVLSADGFCPTNSEALVLAAMKVEEIGRRILAQAERLRIEAARPEVVA